MPFHQNKLPGYIIKVGVFMKCCGILGIERLSHVETIEPHLMRIDLFVPEPTVRRSRMRLQLLTKQCGSFPVFFLTCHFVKQQQAATGIDVVEVVLSYVVSANTAVGVDEVVDSFLYETEVTTIACIKPYALDTF